MARIQNIIGAYQQGVMGRDEAIFALWDVMVGFDNKTTESDAAALLDQGDSIPDAWKER